MIDSIKRLEKLKKLAQHPGYLSFEEDLKTPFVRNGVSCNELTDVIEEWLENQNESP